jgi:tetratricopeptide (TPR) repeat protein
VEARVNLGAAFAQTKKYDQAIVELREAIKLQPQDADAQFLLGNLYLRTKDRKSALASYAELKSLDPVLAKRLYVEITNGRVLFVPEK